MKKSTLFFKVMVLMALLVPWTAWGQELTNPGLPSGADNADIIGSRSMVLNPDGTIPGDNSDDGKNFTITAFNENLTGWTFTGTVHPSNHGLDDYLTVEEQQIKFKINKNKDEVTPTYSSLYFQIQNASGETKWVVYGFVASGAEEIETLTVLYNSDENSRYYTGIALTEAEVKERLTVTATIGEDTKIIDAGDYSITSSLANCVDAGSYRINIQVTSGEYFGQTGSSVLFVIKKRPITVTIADEKKLEFELGTANPTFAASDYLVAKGEDGNANSGLVSKDEKEETPNFTGNLTINASEITEAGNKTVSVTYEETNIQDNTETGFKKDNYDITLSLDNVSVTVKPIEIDADDVKGYDNETDKTVIIGGGTDGYRDTYDGKEHGIGYVTVTVDGKEIALKNDEYSVKYDDADSAPVHVKTGDIKTYNAVITITSENYTLKDGETIKGTIEIEPVTLTVSKKSDVTDLIWNGDDMDLLASKYLEVNGAVNDEGQYISITGNLKNDDTYTGEGYKLVRDDAALTYETGALQTDYTEDWSALENFIVREGNAPVEGGSITLDSDGDEIENLTLTEDESKVYNGYTWTISQIDGQNIPDGADVKVNGEDAENVTIKNVGEYNISIVYTDENKQEHSIAHTLTITQAPLTITAEAQTIYVTSLDNVNSEAEGLVLSINDETVKIDGELGTDEVTLAGSLSLASNIEWALGENQNAITTESVTLSEGDVNKNYQINEKNAGSLNVIYLIDETNKDEFIFFTGDGASRVYNGVALGEGEKPEVSLNIPKVTEYEVTYAPKEEGVDAECADAGDYVATITVTIPEGVPYKIDGKGSLTVDYEITKRLLKLQFSFDTDIQEGETLTLGDNVSLEPVEKLDEENMGFAGKEANEFNAWLENGRISATFKVHTEAVDGKYPVELETITFPKEGENLKYSNYDVTYIVMDADLKPSEEEHPLLDVDEQTPNEDGDYTHEGDDDDIIGGFEPVDNSGHGTITGTNYRKNRLYLADRDFYFNDLYDEEGLILYSRHDKKYTEDGGSFTIWYEHNGEVNEGGYRIFISSKKNKDYKEVKLDEVSGYYQIRNVQSDIYVKIYAMDGFPVANEEITATDARAYAQANKIVVITPEPTDVQIISMAGAVVATDQVTGQREFANLAEGVYIVRMGETVIKLQVRN